MKSTAGAPPVSYRFNVNHHNVGGEFIKKGEEVSEVDTVYEGCTHAKSDAESFGKELGPRSMHIT